MLKLSLTLRTALNSHKHTSKLCTKVLFDNRTLNRGFSANKDYQSDLGLLQRTSTGLHSFHPTLFTRVNFKEYSSQVNEQQSNTIDFDSIFGEDDPKYEENDYRRSHSSQYSERRGTNDLEQELQNLKSKSNISELPSFNKDFYTEHSITANRPQEEIDLYYKENLISVSGQNPPKPTLTFEETNFSSDVLQQLEANDFDKPTPIQAITWPVTLSGRNLVGIAQTGSGKTLSFLLPAMLHIADQPKPKSQDGPIALVLCPTRELAKQCESVASQYFSRRLRTTCLFGGGERSRQIQDLRRGCQLVVATPGRLMDLLADGQLTLNRCTFLVVDEADRMLDMGFEPQIRSIIDLIRPDRQVTMWSATWPSEVQDLASHYLSSDEDPVHIRIGASDLTANEDVEQKFVISSSDKKTTSFFQTLRNLKQDFQSSGGNRFPKILVFANRKVTCDYLNTQINKSGVKAEAIHGDMGQQKRDRIMHGFRRNFFPVMVATDVAARGLDVSNIDYVINFDSPLNSVDYIHRIGRTGRGGVKGTSVTFLTENDGGVVSDIIECVQAVNQPVDEKLFQLKSWWQKKQMEQKGIKRQSKRGYNEHRSDYYRSRQPRQSFRRPNSSRYNQDFY